MWSSGECGVLKSTVRVSKSVVQKLAELRTFSKISYGYSLGVSQYWKSIGAIVGEWDLTGACAGTFCSALQLKHSAEGWGYPK